MMETILEIADLFGVLGKVVAVAIGAAVIVAGLAIIEAAL